MTEREEETAPPWWPDASRALAGQVAAETAGASPQELAAEVERLVACNAGIHDRDCLNLNPATNVMNPRAEAMLSGGLGTRPSLGHPGEKYETGLEAIERIELVAERLARRVFRARFAEVRMLSGAMANLAAFMCCCRPGDAVIVPPATIGGHVTHHAPGAAGLYGLCIHEAPVARGAYTVDVDGLARLAREVRPKLVTVGGSLNLTPHPVAALRAVADEVGARLLFDAAHLSGPIAGGAWPDPLAEGAHLVTMSTYKSLGGPPGGLIVTDDADLAERLDAIAFPGLTANNDAGRVAALAITLSDWVAHGAACAREMAATAEALAEALAAEGLPVHRSDNRFTASHQLALEAAAFGGGQAAARRLRRANLLACGIGLPVEPVVRDMNGLRLGTPEIVRLGLGPAEMPELAHLLARALRESPEPVAPEVTALRARSTGLRFVG